MGGWQRLGVVISILWVIGYPIYTTMSYNKYVDERFNTCISRGGELEWCERVARPHMTVEHIRKTAFGGTHETGPFWLLMLLPVAMLWLVGGIVVGTIRWVWRGFASD
jgi:hypothetical protein